MLKYVDYVCAILVRFINLIFHILPIRFNLWLGRRLGIIVYYMNNSRRIIGYKNLKAAFYKEKTPAEIKKLVKSVYRNLTQIFAEVLSLTKVNKAYVDKYIDMTRARDKYNFAANPNGVILLTAHFGNWELSGITSSIEGFPLVVLAREQKMKRLNELINRLRESKGSKVVRKGVTTKYIVEALHDGKIIGMLSDQDAGKTGVFADFFGRPASTASGSIRIAAKTGAVILPVFIARIKGPYHKLIVEEPITVNKTDDIKPHIEHYNKLLERYVRMYPDQWLWLHKRWKSTPIKKVIILNDGKAGHLNQSLAVCQELKRYREKSGYGESDTKTEVIDVKFRNKLGKWAINFLSIFATTHCQGCMRCLKACLTPDSYKRLMQNYCDIVISCGSGTAGVNRFLSVENAAKNAVIMKPSLLAFKRFQMVVLPKHDAVGTTAENVILTDTVPNLVDKKYLDESAQKLSGIAKLEKPRRIGVLLGGDNSDFCLDSETSEALLGNIISASNTLDADILFTTSRRTPGNIEKIVKQRLNPERRCKFLVIANESNIPHAVGGILGLSDIVVVSGESASMVSEAVYSGKKVVVFRLKKKKRNHSKFEKMLENLERMGYINITDAGRLSEAICRDFHADKQVSCPEDKHNVYMNMWRLGV